MKPDKAYRAKMLGLISASAACAPSDQLKRLLEQTTGWVERKGLRDKIYEALTVGPR